MLCTHHRNERTDTVSVGVLYATVFIPCRGCFGLLNQQRRILRVCDELGIRISNEPNPFLGN